MLRIGLVRATRLSVIRRLRAVGAGSCFCERILADFLAFPADGLLGARFDPVVCKRLERVGLAGVARSQGDPGVRCCSTRIVAVVICSPHSPIVSSRCVTAAAAPRDCFAVLPFEAFETIGALAVAVTLAGARLEVSRGKIVAPGKCNHSGGAADVLAFGTCGLIGARCDSMRV